jgi:hypothetical protein
VHKKGERPDGAFSDNFLLLYQYHDKLFIALFKVFFLKNNVFSDLNDMYKIGEIIKTLSWNVSDQIIK